MSEEAGTLSRRDVLRITAVGGLSLALGGTLARGFADRARLKRVSETRPRLGTLVAITAVHPDAEAARGIVSAGFGEIERLEAILSRHARGTPMSELNERGRLDGAPVELVEVLRRAASWHELTGGAFDPTVAPLLDLYREWAEAGRGMPDERRIQEARALVGFDRVRVGDGSGSADDPSAIVVERPGARLTLDGIAKGYVVDRTVARVVHAGAGRVMIDAGGDMASGGRAVADEPWTVGVQDPHRVEGSLGRIQLAGNAVATSGDYMQAFTADRRHHHIIDPRTGRSPGHVSAVTVVTDTAMDADALSTAVLVMGPEAGLALLERLPNAEGVIVGKDGRRWSSSGFSPIA